MTTFALADGMTLVISVVDVDSVMRSVCAAM